MKSIYTTTIIKNKSKLAVLCVDLHSNHELSFCKNFADKIWGELSLYAKDQAQSLYVRDIKRFSILGKYPGGHTYNRHESMVSVPSWDVDKKQIHSSFAHELHHLVRWQNAGYGDTLGGAITSEGLATYYESLSSGWVPPWAKIKPTKQDWAQAKKEWDNKNYDHFKWFFGEGAKNWLGYSLGYQLAEKMYIKSFNLKHSLMVLPEEAFEFLKV